MTSLTGIGRQPITIVEIDFDLCVNEYAVAPCAAAIGVTGTQKCFKTHPSCQDTDNYSLGDGSPPTEGKLTIRFCTPAENLPRDVVLFPYITGITSTPTELNIGGGDSGKSPLGTRATFTMTVNDHPHHDRGIDPYASERTYRAIDLGTLFSKLLRRNPYYQGRALRRLDGYIGQALEDMLTRHYIVEKIEGPTRNEVRVTAKDPIKLLEFARSQAPFPTQASIMTAIPRAAFDIPNQYVNIPVQLLPAGIGSEFDASGELRIGSELFAFSNEGGDIVRLTQRNLRNTKGGEHKAGDAVQQCYVVTDSRADLVIRDLLVNYCGMPAAYIDDAVWEAEAERWSTALSISTCIASPTSVATLIGEIIKQTLCTIWWDELERKIMFKVMRPRIAGIDDEPEAVNDNAHFIADSVDIRDKPEERMSQVRVWYGQIDPTAGDSAANYAQFKLVVDEPAESAQQYNERRIVEIFARWLSEGQSGAAHALAVRMVKRNRDTPKLIAFSVDAKDRGIKVADYRALTHHALVDLTGAPEERIVQVTSRDDVESGHRTEVQARIAENDTENFAFIEASGAPDYTAATDLEKSFGCWISDAAGQMSNGDEAYRII